MKMKIKKMVSSLMVMTLLLTTVLSNITITFATPTDTKNFIKIPSETEKKTTWTEKIGEGGYSSFQDDKTKALKVDPAYGYKLFKNDDTTFTVTSGTTSSAPSSFNGETIDPDLTDNMKDSSKWKWFDLSKSGNTAGKIEVKISNMKIYQPSVKDYIFVDVVRTVTKINTNSAISGGWIALGTDLSDTIYIGVDEVTTKNTFYKAGTTEEISLKSNISVADIDVYQYVAVSKDKIISQYVSGDTDLYYGEVDGKVYYASRNDTNYSGEACSFAAFTFEGKTFTYTFGRCIPGTDENGNDTILIPSNQYQYLGSGQNMTLIPPGPPIKRISGDNGEQVLHNELRNVAQGWVYFVNQPTPTDVPENFWYDKFEFQDDIDTCLDIEDISIWATNKDGGEDDVTKWFDITKENNQVRASMKKEHLSNASTYQKVSYEMQISVRWHVPEDFEKENEAYIAKWKAHGHYNSTSTVLNVGNEATTVIDEWVQNTNMVDTDVHLSTDETPENPQPGLAITKNVDHYEYQVGDKINYTVKVWNTNSKADTAYYWIKDISLPEGVELDFNSVKVDGIPEQYYDLEQSGNGWILKSHARTNLRYGTTITVTYSATALKEGNGTLVDNTAITGALGIPEKSDSEQVYINSPKVDVRKTAEQRKYKVGDVVAYTVEIDNRNPGTFMRDIVLDDKVTSSGMKIKEGTVAVLVGGKDITNSVDVTFNDDSTGFNITTPLNLKAGTIPCIDKAPYSSIQNWCDKIKVTYDAVITSEAGESCDNTFTVPATENTNGDKIRDDEDVPSGGGSDEEKVPMKAPQLEITKSANKQTYKVGDTGTYTLVVKQIKEELTAKNVVVTDAFEQTEGMTYDKDSIKVSLNKDDITGKCDISVEGNTFKIETHSDITDEDKLTVTYDVKFSQTGEYKNTAVASSDNTDDDDDDTTIIVEGGTPKLQMEKTSDKKEYNVGDVGKYTLQVKQTKPGLVAENVVIQDKFEQTEGIRIKKDTIKVMLADADITSTCKITADDTGFKIETGKNLSSNDALVVTYDVQFEKEGDYTNAAVASSDNTDEDEDDNTIKVKDSPKLEIQKTSDKKKYNVGDTGKYTLQVKETVSGAVAENVVVKDSFEKTEGVKIDKKSIKVLLGGKDITSKCDITTKNNGFTIKTHKNLSSDEVLVVTYNVKFLKNGTYKNVAIASSDNTPSGKGKNTVTVPKDETPKPEVNSPKSTPNNSTPSSYMSPKTGEQAIHIGFIIALVVIAATIVVIAIKKKKQKTIK